MEVLTPLVLVALGALLTNQASRVTLPTETIVTAAPAVGLGFVSLSFFGWRFVNAPATSFLPAFTFVCAAALVVAWWLSKPECEARLQPRAHGWIWRVGLVFVVAAVLIAARAFQLYRFDAPVGEFDAKAIWNVRALLLVRAQEPLAEVFRELQYGHPSYPLFLPAGLAGQFALLGSDNILTPAVQALTLTLAAAVTIWSGLRLLGAARWAPIAAALFLSTPEVLHWGFSQCADMPVAYLLAAAAVGLACQLRQGSRPQFPAWLAGIFVGFLPWTKNEGVLLLGIILFAWFVARRSIEPARRPSFTTLLAGTAPGLLSLIAFKMAWSPKDEISVFANGAITRALDPERWQIVASAFWEQFSPWTGAQDWGAVWLLLAVLFALGWRAFVAGPQMQFLSLSLTLAYLAWFGVYLGTVHDPAWHLETSLNRLLLQLLPLTLVVAFLALERGWLATSARLGEAESMLKDNLGLPASDASPIEGNRAP